MAGFFTSKKKKEENIRELMNRVPESDEYKTCKKLCAPLNVTDLAGKELNYQIIDYLSRYRSVDFATEVVNQASNSEALKNLIKENYITELMKGRLLSDEIKMFEINCTPLTVEDFAGRTLSKKNIYILKSKLDTDFVVDILRQASNSASLMKDILDDLTPEGFERKKEDYYSASEFLKAAYHKGFYTKEIGAKEGNIRRHDDNGMGCAWHEDRWDTLSFNL